jgi:hypothetical protein
LKDICRDKIELAFMVAAAAFLGLAIIGGLRGYSPVPFWDMWDAYLNFYLNLGSGDWSAWWVPHNEHRPVLAKIFFWMDLAWFHGSVWFLLLINYLLAGCIWLVFWLFAQEAAADQLKFIRFFLLAWVFSWSQEDNFSWGFQSQFFLAQLLPLSAFYFLYLSANYRTKSRAYFILAAIFGILSIGSMANGVLALPLMTLYAVLGRLGWRKSLLLAGLSLAAAWVYFLGMQTSGLLNLFSLALRQNLLGLIQFVLLYLGGPFFYLCGKGKAAQNVAQLAGLFLLISSLAFAWRAWRGSRDSTLSLALLTFILYIGGTAAVTAVSRLHFGFEYASTSRYMTPALMAWASLLILGLPTLLRLPDAITGKLWIAFLLLLMFMLPTQLKALQSHQQVLFERNIAALALALGILDQAQIGTIHDQPDAALPLAKKAAAGNLSVFGRPPLKNARERLGTQSALGAAAAAPCQGHLDAVQKIIGDARYLQVSGWIFNPATHSVPDVVDLVDSQGRVVGLALTGQPRLDVAQAVAPAAAYSGFKGYLSADQQGKTVTLQDTAGSCQLSIQVPNISYHHSQGHSEAVAVTVSHAQGLPSKAWLERDHYQSCFLRRGDRLLYRSGPTSGRQFVELVGSPFPLLSLPPGPEWTQLAFSHQTLPDEFDVNFSDRGSGRGEWSALAGRAK